MKYTQYQTITHPIQPVYDAHSKILILGSFPSVKTREYGFFYGHPQNRFWPLFSTLFQTQLPITIDERKSFLLNHHIAIYDTIYQCDIVGSSDTSIKNVVPTDLSQINNTCNIRQVFCNGGTAYKYYQKYHDQNFGIKGIQLPSTSPANARYRLNDLVKEWQQLLEYLN